MRKFYIFGLVALAAVIIGLAWAETITLSTYYPAPYGVYNELRAKRMAIGDAYYDATANPWGGQINTDADLVVEGKVGIGTTDPQAKLDICSDSSGFLPPRIETAKRPTLGAAGAGMVIYNTDIGMLELYDGSNWKPVGGDSIVLLDTPEELVWSNGATFDLSKTVPVGAKYAYFTVITLWQGESWDNGANLMAASADITDITLGTQCAPNEYTVNYESAAGESGGQTSTAIVKLNSQRKVKFKLNFPPISTWAAKIYLIGYVI